jgi:hypothetical protein
MYINEGGLDDSRVVELLDIHVVRALASRSTATCPTRAAFS